MDVNQELIKLKKIDSKLIKIKARKKIAYILMPIGVGFYCYYRIKKTITQLQSKKRTIICNITEEVNKKIKKAQSDNLLINSQETYLISREKRRIIQNCKEINSCIQAIKKSAFLTQKGVQSYQKVIIFIKGVAKQAKECNEEFIKSRIIEYDYLFRKLPFPLDEQQKRAVVTDDTHNLVIAGAGSGKTEVLATRIAYLIERKPDAIDPERILALAYQNKAAQEIKDRLKTRFDIDVKVKTFHSFGNEILGKTNNPPKLKFPGENADSKFKSFISEIVNEKKQDPVFKEKIIEFIKYYGDDEIPQNEDDFSTNTEFFDYMIGQTYTTLNGTTVKSNAERVVMNFFLMYAIDGKSINIKYEDEAKWMEYGTENGKKRSPKPDFFLPDYEIYIEVWSLDKENKVPEWFTGENPSADYKEIMEIKREKFKQQQRYGLIEIFAWETQLDDVEDIIQKRITEILQKRYPNRSFTISELPYEEIVKKVYEECHAVIDDLAFNIANFIVIAKTYHLTPDLIHSRLSDELWSIKQKNFGFLALEVYQTYERQLREANEIDFQDMINLAVGELKRNQSLYKDSYDHILIDEYQDISTQRFDLIKELMVKTEKSKLFCVGDDWQSIMGFAGSNIDLFIHFSAYFDYPTITYLTKNYRSCKSIVDLGAAIIRGNTINQIQKDAIANNPTKRKIIAYSSQSKDYQQRYTEMRDHCIKKVKEYIDRGYDPDDILILARIVKKDIIATKLLNQAARMKVPISDEPKKKGYVHLMSIHKSKGLQARVVFLLDVIDNLWGLPCKLENPDIMAPAIKGNTRIHVDEERRLFYVAATRAKEDLIIYTQEDAKSDFLLKIEDHLTFEKI